LFEACDTGVLVETLRSENYVGLVRLHKYNRSWSLTIEWWRHKLDLDLVIGSVLGLSATERSLDSVDTLIAEASD
jgi:hypothetical protein